MYNLAIYIYMLAANIVSLFNKKVKLMICGHRNTWKLLREQIGEDHYIWFHAASLGEFEQGRPLIEHIKKEHPDKKILLTFFSPSGYEVRKDYKYADIVCYLPFDTPANAHKFVRLAHPEMAFFIKYEFWLNYIGVLYQKKIPMYSVSCIFRRNQIFFQFYGFLFARVLRRMTRLYVQDLDSKKLLEDKLNLKNIKIVGDTRFDRVADIRKSAKELSLLDAFSNGYKVLVAGSSWPPDEDILIDYFNKHPDYKLILAPHVVKEEHLKEIESKLKIPFVRYTQAKSANMEKMRCVIIDCYGLLSSIYRYGEMAYIGGGFGVGIHNVTEAAIYGIPVIFGPKNEKFREAQELLALKGAFQINKKENFFELADNFFTNKEATKKTGAIASNYIYGNTGATTTIYSDIDF